MAGRSGSYRHLVDILQHTTTQDAAGHASQTNETLYSKVPARVEPLKGKEFFDSSVRDFKVSTRISIRHHDGISPDMLVTHNGKTYDIIAVLPDDTHLRGIDLMCEEKTTGA